MFLLKKGLLSSIFQGSTLHYDIPIYLSLLLTYVCLCMCVRVCVHMWVLVHACMYVYLHMYCYRRIRFEAWWC